MSHVPPESTLHGAEDSMGCFWRILEMDTNVERLIGIGFFGIEVQGSGFKVQSSTRRKSATKALRHKEVINVFLGAFVS